MNVTLLTYFAAGLLGLIEPGNAERIKSAPWTQLTTLVALAMFMATILTWIVTSMILRHPAPGGYEITGWLITSGLFGAVSAFAAKRFADTKETQALVQAAAPSAERAPTADPTPDRVVTLTTTTKPAESIGMAEPVKPYAGPVEPAHPDDAEGVL
jgi:hypothetical protein